MKRKLCILLLVCCIGSVSMADLVTVDYSQGTTSYDDLTMGVRVYGLDVSGNLVVAGGPLPTSNEILTGSTTYASSISNMLTLTSAATGGADVVQDGTGADFLEANVSGPTWDTTGLTKGFRVQSGKGMTPVGGNNGWSGDELMVLDIIAPAGTYDSLDVNLSAASSHRIWLVGDTDVADGVGPGNFSASLAPGETLSVLLANTGTFGGGTAGAKRLKSISMDFVVVPEPATLAMLGLGGLFLRRRRA